MIDDTVLPFAFPAVDGKKITAAFDGGRITSNGGVMVLAAAERKLGIAAKLAAMISDRHRAVAAGELEVIVGGVYPLSEARRAHEDLAGRRTSGKLLLNPAA